MESRSKRRWQRVARIVAVLFVLSLILTLVVGNIALPFLVVTTFLSGAVVSRLAYDPYIALAEGHEDRISKRRNKA